MTKAEMVAAMSKEAKISKAAAEKALNAFAAAIMKAAVIGARIFIDRGC